MAERKWLTVIGIEDCGLENLTSEALLAINNADVIFGGKRHLAMLGEQNARKVLWQKPFAKSVAEIGSLRGQSVVVLATGDPQWFGIGAVLVHNFAIAEMLIIPARGAFSLAASRLGWSLSSVQTLTLHGRKFDNIARFIFPNSLLLVLSNDGDTPTRIASHLEARGFGQSRITVLEHIGGALAKVLSSQAAGFDLDEIADLNVVAIECAADIGAKWYPLSAGLPDDAYTHDGQLTKSVVRAATLAALRPYSGALLWDVGAGCGSISIEWMRVATHAKAIAVEADAGRCELIVENATRLGVPDIKIVEGNAPALLDDLQPPDAIFIGGGLTTAGVFDICWQRLKPGGVLVANGVTLESEAMLIGLHESHGGELSRISVEQAAPMGSFRGWKQAKPVIQWQVIKPGGNA